MSRIYRFIIRSTTFFRKELVEILRQPRLILTLVLGPFIIMLLFGLAYRNQARSLRTLFVVPQNSQFTSQVKSFAETLGPQIIYQGIVHDKQAALNELSRGQLDLVVVVPPQPLKTIENNKQAMLELYDNEIDPFQESYVRFVGNLYVDELNRRILRSITESGQQKAGSLQSKLEAAKNNAEAMKQALQQGDLATAMTQKEKLSNNVNIVRILVGTSLGVLQGMESSFGNDNSGYNLGQVNDITQTLSDINQSLNLLGDFNSSTTDLSQKQQEITKVEDQISKLESSLAEFRAMDPTVLISPFTSQTQSLAKVQLTPTGFYAPAVIVLLIQHLFVTFAGLSIVQERRAGTMELFRVSPISAFETLLGKNLSYLTFGALIAVLITGMVVWVLGVPMLGSWVDYGITLAVLLFTSLSMGFLISLISRTDTQAVQYAMLLLLASIFFSGFFLDLRLMWGPMRSLSWLLPATYAIRILQDVMLRGNHIPLLLIIGISGIGLALFLIDWFILKRKMSQS